MTSPSTAPPSVEVPATPVLHVVSRPAEGIDRLLPYSDGAQPLVWLRRREGMVGHGEALRLEFHGPERIREAAAAWRRIAEAAQVDDTVNIPGSGLIAFGSFTFTGDSALPSVLIVPRTVVGRRGDTTWTTELRLAGDGAEETAADAHPLVSRPEPSRFGDEYRIQLLPGALDREAFQQAVSTVIERIGGQGLDKAVIARDLVGHLPHDADLRLALRTLALGYPDCWTFAVDGFLGSSPETLVSVSEGTVSARVLAGSAARGADADADHEAAVALATSEKDLDEHQYALTSVLAALGAHSTRLATSELPFALKLPNLWHLSSDVEGTLGDGSSSLDLVDALHPTAAVAGTPRPVALATIAELEPFDRGRYAGPVGWVGASGDGEWAIALRCAQVSDEGTITAYAGCGIVAESDPVKELAETKLKFRPIVEAFG